MIDYRVRSKFEKLTVKTDTKSMDVDIQTPALSSALSSMSDANIEYLSIQGETAQEQSLNTIKRLLTNNGATRMERLLKLYSYQQANRNSFVNFSQSREPNAIHHTPTSVDHFREPIHNN